MTQEIVGQAPTRVTLADALDPDLLASGQDLADAGDLLTDGFPSADLIPVVLAQVPGQMLPGRPVAVPAPEGSSVAARFVLSSRKGSGQAEGPHGRVRLSAGTVGLVAMDEARAERSRTAHRTAKSLRATPGLALRVGAPVELADGAGFVDLATGEVVGAEWEGAATTRGRITEWSGKSRANMIRRMASTDWRPMFRLGFAPMVTLTYPGPWTVFAPTREVVGKHLEAFKEAYRREFMKPIGERVMGSWKVEYQRRGAPHLHLLLPVPPGMAVQDWRTWVGETWHRIVWDSGSSDLLRCLQLVGHDADGASLIAEVHRVRHSEAGTAVDFAEGVRLRDPRRIALYFLGHSLSHAKDGGKEYQHRLPASYAGRAGRWWGIWGLEDTTRDVYVDADTWWQIRDALAAFCLSRERVAFQGGRMFGGWVAVNDGPEELMRLLERLPVNDGTPDP